MNTPMTDVNPDQSLVHQFANGSRPCAIDTNPLAVSLGAQLLHVERDPTRVTLAFAPNSTFLQGNGVVQGGIVCAMLDFSMAFAMLAQLPLGDTAASVTISISFLRPVQPGKLLATGSVDRLGKNIGFVQGMLVTPDRKLLATASSTFAVLRQP